MTQKPQPGDTFVFYRSGLVYHRVHGSRIMSEISKRGETFTVTADDLGNVDRNGASWLDLAYDAQRQLDRWGYQMFGPFDPDAEPLTAWDPSNAADVDQERARRLDALSGASETEREKARLAMDRELGRPQTSVTLNARGSR